MTHRSGDEERPSAARLRAQHKDVMRTVLLEAAAELVAEEGEAALTMKRLADRFGSSVGMIYRLFESKNELLAAIRGIRVEGLAEAADAAVVEARARLERKEIPADARALADVLSAGRFWVGAAQREPDRVDVVRDLLLCGGGGVADHAATELALRSLTAALDVAEQRGALAAGSARARAATIVVVGSVAAPTMDPGGDPAHARGLGSRLLDALLLGWSADPQALEVAAEALA